MLRSFLIFIISVSAFAEIPIATITNQVEMVDRYEGLIFNSSQERSSLTKVERQKLLKIVSENKVASLSRISIYDPPQNGQPVGEIGYCYGRAMAAHLIARRMGLASESIKKIFAAGDMQNRTVRWRFHMATLVLGDDGYYYAIDPIMPALIKKYNLDLGTILDPLSPLRPKKWIQIVKHFYDNTKTVLEMNPGLENNPLFKGTIKFYVTNTDAIMVDMREVPASIRVENGRRIIEVLFDPDSEEGFSPVYEQGEILYYDVISRETLEDYFTTYNEPLVEQFNFYKMDVDIIYIKDDVLSEITRNYLYNGKLSENDDFQHFSLGYFSALLKSIETFSGVFDD